MEPAPWRDLCWERCPSPLIVGPPNSGRAGEIRARLEAALDRDPVLVVPTLDDADRFERELCTRPRAGGGATAVVGASIRTFRRLHRASRGGDRGASFVPSSRTRSAWPWSAPPSGRPSSRRSSGSAARRGFAPALERLIAELQASLVTPGELASAAAELEDGALRGRARPPLRGLRRRAGRGRARRRPFRRSQGRGQPARAAASLGRPSGAPLRVRRPDRGAARAGGGAGGRLPGHGRRQLRGPRGAGAARRAAGAASRRARRRGGEQARLRRRATRRAPTLRHLDRHLFEAGADPRRARRRDRDARMRRRARRGRGGRRRGRPAARRRSPARTTSRWSCGTPIAAGPCSRASSRDSGSRSRSRRRCRWLEPPPAAASPRWRARACPRAAARSCSPSCGPARASRRESATGSSAACCAARRAPRTS